MGDGLLVVGVVAGMGLAAALTALTLGVRIARRSRLGATLLSGFLPSIALLLIEGGLFVLDKDVGGDGPAMALAGSIIYAVIALPVTLTCAAVMIRWRLRHFNRP